jgi:hypothetical protein
MLYEIGIRVRIETPTGSFVGTIQSIVKRPQIIPTYMVLLDVDNTLVESLLVYPLTEE